MRALADIPLRTPIPRRKWRIAAWALLLLAGHSLQVVAATHWHGAADAEADVAGSQIPPDLPGHDGCLLCQAAAHTGDNAPPPAPWILRVAHELRSQSLHEAGLSGVALRRSHAWQGRAPPQV